MIIQNGKKRRDVVVMAEDLIKTLIGIICIFLLMPVVVSLKVFLLKPLRYFVAYDLDQLYKLTKEVLLSIIGDVAERLILIHIFLVFATLAIGGIFSVIYSIIKVFIK